MNEVKNLKDKRGSDKLPRFFYNRLGVLCLRLFLLFLSLNLNFPADITSAQDIKGPLRSEDIVTGTGIIVKENVALARNDAISQAFLKAVEEYLIRRLESQGMASNFQRLYEEIMPKAKEVIQDYQILSEFSTDRYVRVLMKARINEAVLEQKLKDMGLLGIDSMQTDVLFLISENKEGFPGIYWWADPSDQPSLTQTELTLSRIFEDRGFRVINRSFFPSEESYDESMINPSLSDEAAVKWGKLLSAQIVIAGEANIYEQLRASVFLKAIKVMDGKIVAQGYREGLLNSEHGDIGSAIELAVKNWADDMISYIIEVVKPSENVINQIIIAIEGLNSFREFLDFKEFLKNNFPEIKWVLERSLKRDLVEISVKVEGDLRGLAEKVVNHPKRPFSFEINELSDQGFTVIKR